MIKKIISSRSTLVRSFRTFSRSSNKPIFASNIASSAILCATLAGGLLYNEYLKPKQMNNSSIFNTMSVSAEEPQGRLEEKVAIVTGASTGIGEAIATRFVEEGARVIFVDINPDGQQIVQQINKKYGQERAIFQKADISSEKDVKGFVDLAMKKWGRVDIMVNNAALFIFKSFDGSVEEWQRSFNINVIGTMLCTRYATAAMKQSKRGGSVINLSSVSAFEGTPNFAIYAMTKGAIMQMTRDFASDLGPHNIRVNAICPGTIVTSATERDLKRQNMSKQEFLDLHSGKTYLDRVGKPEEVAGVAVFLASDDSSFVTGSPVFVDGGRESKF